jgi:hypothetical protein
LAKIAPSIEDQPKTGVFSMTNQPSTTTDRTFNGHPSWEHWNVFVWVNNSIGLYRLAYLLTLQHGEEQAARMLFGVLEGMFTPERVAFHRRTPPPRNPRHR